LLLLQESNQNKKPFSPGKGRERSRGTTLFGHDKSTHSPLFIRNGNDAPWPTLTFGMELQGDVHSCADTGLPPSPARCNQLFKSYCPYHRRSHVFFAQKPTAPMAVSTTIFAIYYK